MTAAIATDPTSEYGRVDLVLVHFDDLDPMGMVHNARYALLVERALATFWRQRGHTFRGGRPTTADAFNVVKEFSINYHAPDLWDRTTTRAGRAVHLLSYIVHCGVCGGPISMGTVNRHSWTGHVYSCLKLRCAPLDA
jgi:Thioesterase superfamily